MPDIISLNMTSTSSDHMGRQKLLLVFLKTERWIHFTSCYVLPDIPNWKSIDSILFQYDWKDFSKALMSISSFYLVLLQGLLITTLALLHFKIFFHLKVFCQRKSLYFMYYFYGNLSGTVNILSIIYSTEKYSPFKLNQKGLFGWTLEKLVIQIAFVNFCLLFLITKIVS